MVNKAKVYSLSEKKPIEISEVEQKLEELSENLKNNGNLNLDTIEDFKQIAYNLCLQRYLTQLKILKSIEEQIEMNVRQKQETDKELINSYRILCKGVDVLNSQLRLLVPSKTVDDDNENIDNIIKEVTGENNSEICLKSVIIFQIKEILKNISRLRNQLSLFDVKSLEYWKLSNSFMELLNKLNDLIKTYEKITKDDGDDSEGLSMSELLKTVEEIKNLEKKDLKTINENWEKQQQGVVTGEE
jgi:hypothetical protein